MLEVKNLHVHYSTDHGIVKAVNGVTFTLKTGETIGLVGETGAGKTTTALGILRLVPNPPGRIIEGDVILDGESLLSISEKQMRKIRGEKIAMIFQDPMTSLNPVLTVGEQISEIIKLHYPKMSKADVYLKAAQMLELVGIPSDRIAEYPHQFSGGMKQRVLIAIALACDPGILIADEPTSALDVTIQAQVLSLLSELKKKLNTSLIMITHDLGVVAEVCDKVAIMYAGEIVEYGSIREIYKNAKHPYTIGLFESIPSMEKRVKRLKPIPGLMPDPTNLSEGCSFSPRCPYATETCRKKDPKQIELSEDHYVKCLKFSEESSLWKN